MVHMVMVYLYTITLVMNKELKVTWILLSARHWTEQLGLHLSPRILRGALGGSGHSYDLSAADEDRGHRKVQGLAQSPTAPQRRHWDSRPGWQTTQPGLRKHRWRTLEPCVYQGQSQTHSWGTQADCQPWQPWKTQLKEEPIAHGSWRLALPQWQACVTSAIGQETHPHGCLFKAS